MKGVRSRVAFTDCSVDFRPLARHFCIGRIKFLRLCLFLECWRRVGKVNDTYYAKGSYSDILHEQCCFEVH
jgi:hypothetical protein